MFDGHSGSEVAQFLSQNFTRTLVKLPEYKHRRYEDALLKAFQSLDQSLSSEKYAWHAGSTACVVLLTPETLYCASCGDSRCVASSQAQPVVQMSIDHKPDLPVEAKRIEQAGFYIDNNRIMGRLAMSRCFGDFEYKANKKKGVICLPDICAIERQGLVFAIVASDGLWDCLSSLQCV